MMLQLLHRDKATNLTCGVLKRDVKNRVVRAEPMLAGKGQEGLMNR